MPRIYLVSCVALAMLSCWGLSANAAPVNFGFEDDSPGSAPSGWVVTAADEVVVVGSEGADDYAVYGRFPTLVEPRFGLRMLRLASPRDGNESQARGASGVSQSFVSESGRLTFSLRVFSFEHRGDDSLTIDVQGAAGAAIHAADASDLTIDVAQGQDPRCAALPCTLTLDVGRSTDRLDSGWLDVVIEGLPTQVPLTLVYRLDNGQNDASPTWVYFDADSNAPPVAALSYAPGRLPGTVALEGDFVVFDCLGSSDTAGDELTCTWSAAGPGVPQPNTVEGPFALYSFPEDGAVDVTLTVSDGLEQDTVTQTVLISNGVPLVNAPDLEILEGTQGQALCRYLDPGVNDEHTVTITVAGQIVQLTETASESEPTLASGFARGFFDGSALAPGVYDGSCSVADDDGTGIDDFTLTVITPTELALRETADTGTTSGAPVVEADRMVLGNLDLLGGDVVDVMELRGPSGAQFRPGAEVLVSIDVSADFDAVLLSMSDDASAAPFVSAPFVSLPFVSAPFVSVPFVSAPFVSLPFVSVPFVSAPFVSAPFVSAPFVSAPLQTSPFVSANLTFSQFPLTQVGEAAPDGGTISSADVEISEILPLQQTALLNEPVRVKAISAELGTGSEQMLVRIGPGESALYLALFPQPGAISTAPYAVTIEASTPPPQSRILGAACNGSPLVASSAPLTVLRAGGGTPRTLVVTQRERMVATWNMQDFDGAFLPAMDPYFNHERVAARVISLPSALFDQADRSPCDVQAQNLAAEQVKAIIQAELAANPSIEYVQLMGGFDIVTPFYTPDATSTGYEGLYAQDLWVQPATPLAVAVAEGNNITDAYYVDAEPQPFQGRELFVEDLPIARLVESPEEMIRAAATFVAQDGRIDFGGTLTTGYDFFSDGAAANAAVLQGLPGAIGNTVLNRDDWTVDELSCNFTGSPTACPAPGPQGVTALGAHMTYNAALSAAGFTALDFNQAMEVTTAADVLDGTLTVSLGCHSGLSVPDAWALPEDAGLPFSPSIDWVQQAGDWIGSYTYAYGDDLVADRGTEGIITLVLENLAAGRTLGEALVRAKWRYATGLFEFGVYDEKSLIALTLFGMPQATLAGTSPLPATPAATAALAASSPAGTLSLRLTEQGTTTTTTHVIDRNSESKGVWYTFDGQAQGVVGRPALPVVKPVEGRVTPAGETTIHGIALRGGAFTLYQGEDPAFPVQQHDWVQSIGEPQPCVGTMSPTQLAGATRFDTAGGTLQTVIVQGGQFRCTSGRGTTPVLGDFRIFHELDLEALHPRSPTLDSDFEPPTVTRLDLFADPASGAVTASLDAVDNGAVVEIVGLVFADDDGSPGGTGRVTAYTTGDISGVGGPHELVMANGAGNFLGFQFIDDAGNITWRTQKGALFTAVGVEIRTSFINGAGSTTLVVAIGGFEMLDAPVLVLDFGDGSPPQSYALTDDAGAPVPGITIDPATGTAEFRVSHGYAGTTPTVTVVADVTAQGATGSDRRTIARCSDPVGDASQPDSDIVGCGISASGSIVSIDYYVDGLINPGVQYRVELPQSNKLLKYKAGQVTGPGGVQLVVAEITSDGTSTDGLRFTFRASRLGWDGVSPLEFRLVAQDGVAGAPGVGFEDETEVFSFNP